MSGSPNAKQSTGYLFENATPQCTQGYLWPPIIKWLEKNGGGQTKKRVFEIGCGNGAFANHMTKLGYHVTGVDPSESGIAHANKAFPNLFLELGSADDPLVDRYGLFPIVLSLEVVEHCYFPSHFARNLYEMLEKDGIGIFSTPYHGYLKNLALAVTGRMDQHFDALSEGGHIKFWSMKTLRKLLENAGFQDIHFLRVGRLPFLAKSMIAIVHK